jgi:hypothetical protein
LGRSASEMHPRGEIAAPERRGEARGKPPRRRAWLRKPMVRKRIGIRPTGKAAPASRPCLMGQRLHPTTYAGSKGDRGLTDLMSSPKDVRGKPDLPPDQSGYRDERDGSLQSRCLQASAEDIDVNVGGPCVEGCSPPVKRMGVGAAIVLGARESRVQGEGRQGSDVWQTNSRRSPWESLVELGDPSCFDERKPMTAYAGSRHSLESRMR